MCCCKEEVKPTYKQLKTKNEELELKLNRAEKLIQALGMSLSGLATANDKLNEERLYWKSEFEEMREINKELREANNGLYEENQQLYEELKKLKGDNN